MLCSRVHCEKVPDSVTEKRKRNSTMKKSMGLLGLVAVAAVVLMGCGGDYAPDSAGFQNKSMSVVTVNVAVTFPSNTMEEVTLEPGAEWQTLKSWAVEPLTYTYSPTDTVAATPKGDFVLFTDRVVEN
jgi:hypothetical protein